MFRSRHRDPSEEDLARLAKIVSRAKAVAPCAGDVPAAAIAAPGAEPSRAPKVVPSTARSETSSAAPGDAQLEEPSEALLAAMRKAFPEMSTEAALAALRLES